jgi:hypothetical protein
MNQETQGYRLKKKNRGSKISWDCPFKMLPEYTPGEPNEKHDILNSFKIQGITWS